MAPLGTLAELLKSSPVMHEISEDPVTTKQELVGANEIAGITDSINDKNGSFAPQHPIDPVELMVQK